MDESESLPVWDSWAQGPYLVEIARQCTFAIHAARELRGALLSEGIGWRAWYATQAFLNATGNVSKLLSPPTPPHKRADEIVMRWRIQRGEKLREALEVPENSPVLTRGLRDSFEHIDERLDEWIVKQPRPTVEDYEAGTLPKPPTQPSVPLRIIAADRFLLGFRDVEVDVPAVIEEVGRILGRVHELEPLLTKFEPGFGALLALLQPLPTELRLDAPTRRPDEPVTAGLPPTTLPSLEQALGDVISKVRGSAQPDCG